MKKKVAIISITCILISLFLTSVDAISKKDFGDFLKKELRNYFEEKNTELESDELIAAFEFYFDSGENVELSQSDLSQDSINIIENEVKESDPASFAEGNCIDSDNGKNYFSKGECYITGKYGSKSSSPNMDFCGGRIGGAARVIMEVDTLNEYYCEDNECKLESYRCYNGCNEGKCNSEKWTTLYEKPSKIGAVFAVFLPLKLNRAYCVGGEFCDKDECYLSPKVIGEDSSTLNFCDDKNNYACKKGDFKKVELEETQECKIYELKYLKLKI